MRVKLMVTGGAGFIGSALIRLLGRRRDVHIVNLDALTYAADLSALAHTTARYQFVEGDICDGALVRQLLNQYRPDGIIHLAAQTHVDRSISDPAPFVQSNIIGTATLLEALREYAPMGVRFLYVSTDEVYGSVCAPVDEAAPMNPSSPYAASKASAEHLVMSYVKTYGLPAMISRGTNTYGPHQNTEKLIPKVITNALSGAPIGLYGSGEQQRDWLHVEDHARALWRIFERGRAGAVYNIGANTPRRNLDVVESICTELSALTTGGDFTRQIVHIEDRAGHDFSYSVSARKLETELGWSPNLPFERGLRDTVAWYAGRLRSLRRAA